VPVGYLTTNSFCPTFINQVIVINKDHIVPIVVVTIAYEPKQPRRNEKFQNEQREERIKGWEPLT